MTVKALRRQLVAAIAMVLVATVALGSSTYAWFVNNNSVKAEGMSVNAKADDSLLIKGAADSDFGSVGTTTISQLNMKPATSADGVNFAKLGEDVVVKEKTDATATWSGSEGAFKAGDLVAVTPSEKTTYYEEATYTIKSINENADIYVSEVDVTDSKNIFKAIRVSVTIGDTTKVYNPEESTNVGNEVGSKSGDNFVLASDTGIYTNYDAASLWTLTKDQEYTATVRVWFEGQDTNCFTDNIETTGSGITVTFAKNDSGQ